MNLRSVESKENIALKKAIALGNSYVNDIVDIDAANHKNLSNKNDLYELSERLLFLIQLHEVTNNERFLYKASNMALIYLDRIEKNNVKNVHLSMSLVCLELYDLTKNEIYFTGALSIIRFENSVNTTGDCAEQLQIRNLFILLRLFDLSNREEVLLKINLSILKLLGAATFVSGGIYWPFLYRLAVPVRCFFEGSIKLLFFELYKSFKNDTFLYIAKNISVKKTRSKSNEQPEVEKRSGKLSGIHWADAVIVDILVQLNEYAFFEEKREIDYVPDILKTIKNKYPVINNNDLVSRLFVSIINTYGIEIILENQSKEVLAETSDKTQSNKNLCFSQKEIKQLFSKSSGLNAHALTALFYPYKTTNPFFIFSGKNKFKNDVENYPGILLSVAKAKQIIISSRFPKTLLLIRDEFVEKLTHFLNSEDCAHNEWTRFIVFVTQLLKSNSTVKRHLSSVYKLELASHRLQNKYQVHQSNFDERLQKDIDVNDEELFKLKLIVSSNFKTVKVKLNEALKIYAFTSGQFITSADDILIMTWYNTKLNRTEELLVDHFDIIILRLFEMKMNVKKSITKLLSFISYNADQLEEVHSMIIKRIRNMITEGVLIKTDN